MEPLIAVLTFRTAFCTLCTTSEEKGHLSCMFVIDTYKIMKNLIKLIKQTKVMESGNHFKNGTSLKYLLSRRMLTNEMLRLSLLAITCMMLGISLNACGTLVNAANAINQTAYNQSTLVIKPISNQIDLRFESCIRDGKSVIITYYLRNNTGKNFRMLNIGGSTSWCPNGQGEYTTIVDDRGNNYNTAIGDRDYTSHELAGERKREGSINVTLPNDIWVKGIYTIYNVDPAANSFQIVNIAFDQYGGGNLCYDASYGFKNLPIDNQ